MPVSNRDIARYYDKHQIIYTLFWSRNALHYGLWYEDTKNLAEAISNTNRFVADALAIGPADTVLDAGCGVGGTSVHIAETTGAKVEGITLSDVQVKIARRSAIGSPAAGLLHFSKQDFTATNFRENTFSKVFGIESICYAHRKIDFLNEAYRVMMPGGKIAVVDLFLTRGDLDAQEVTIYKKTIGGWVVPNVSTTEDFQESLEQAGFKDVAFHNLAEHIKKSTEKLYYRNLPFYPLAFLKAKLGLGRENFSPIYQKALFAKRIATYGAFVAVKPELTIHL